MFKLIIILSLLIGISVEISTDLFFKRFSHSDINDPPEIRSNKDNSNEIAFRQQTEQIPNYVDSIFKNPSNNNNNMLGQKQRNRKLFKKQRRFNKLMLANNFTTILNSNLLNENKDNKITDNNVVNKFSNKKFKNKAKKNKLMISNGNSNLVTLNNKDQNTSNNIGMKRFLKKKFNNNDDNALVPENVINTENNKNRIQKKLKSNKLLN